jgi:uncharacterized damage-inducible protein DinB
MFNSIDEFLREWESEVAITERLFDQITDGSLSQKIAANHFTLGQLAWHITYSVREILSAKQLVFDGPENEGDCPTKASEILETYRRVNTNMVNAMKMQWKDENLEDVMNVYGSDWSNQQTLRMLINHQIHHRGQLTVLMRQASLFVHGTYGPSREQWSQMGMSPPDFVN